MTNTLAEALAYAGRQHVHTDMPASLKAQGFDDWEGACQGFVRSCWDIGPLFGSAFAQWLGADAADRHPGGNPADAPLGSALCYKGTGPNGHIMFAARDFPRGAAGAWSNDLVRTGKIDKVLRTDPTTHWGQGYLGYLTAINDVDLPIGKPASRPRPKQIKRYAAIHTAINNLGASLDVAKRQHDAADAKTLEAEIARLEKMYAKLRRS